MRSGAARRKGAGRHRAGAPRPKRAAPCRPSLVADLAPPLAGRPAVARLVRRLPADAALAGLSRARLPAAAGEALDADRARVRGQGTPPADADTLVVRIAEGLRRTGRFSLRPVINATGVVLHTNLGRALLSHLAPERGAEAAAA